MYSTLKIQGQRQKVTCSYHMRYHVLKSRNFSWSLHRTFHLTGKIFALFLHQATLAAREPSSSTHGSPPVNFLPSSPLLAPLKDMICFFVQDNQLHNFLKEIIYTVCCGKNQLVFREQPWWSSLKIQRGPNVRSTVVSKENWPYNRADLTSGQGGPDSLIFGLMI